MTFWMYAAFRLPSTRAIARSERNQHDRDPPEDHQAREVRVREADDLGDRDEAPRPDRDDLEDRRRCRRWSSGRFAPRPGRRARARARGTPRAEGSRRRARSPSAVPTMSTAGLGETSSEREHERGEEADEIGEEKQAPHEPPRRRERARHDARTAGRPHVRPMRWQRHLEMLPPTESSPSRPAPSPAYHQFP